MNQRSLINQAVTILKAGGLVALPTETVYGLGADARNESAIKKIFAAKERPHDHPLIVHIGSIAEMQEWARDISLDAKKLAQAFWPGPLTMILKKQAHVSPLLTANQDTIGLRIPNHPIALDLLKAFGGGIAAPSANKFTHISPTTAAAVQAELGDQVDLILEGGACEVGLESTIIDMSGDQPTILRPGMISVEMLEKVLEKPIAIAQKNNLVHAPGRHHLHYAPQTKTYVVSTDELPTYLQQLSATNFPLVAMLWSDVLIEQTDKVRVVNMPRAANLYAHDLYQTLRNLDEQGFQAIVIEAVPENKAWDAIRDRLMKASGLEPLS